MGFPRLVSSVCGKVVLCVPFIVQRIGRGLPGILRRTNAICQSFNYRNTDMHVCVFAFAFASEFIQMWYVTIKC